MASLNEFKSKLRIDSVAPANRFSVAFSAPGDVNGSTNTRSILLYCSAVNIPGINFLSSPVNIYGEPIEFSYQKAYSEVSMTFYLDKNLEVKTLFDNWMESIHSTETREFGFYDDYVTDVDIFVQNKKNKNVYNVKLFEARPKAINDIQLSYNDTQFMSLTVVFSYRYYKVEKGYGQGQTAQVASNSFDELTTGFTDSKFFTDFNGFQESLINSKPAANAKEAMNSILAKTKDLV